MVQSGLVRAHRRLPPPRYAFRDDAATWRGLDEVFAVPMVFSYPSSTPRLSDLDAASRSRAAAAPALSPRPRCIWSRRAAKRRRGLQRLQSVYDGKRLHAVVGGKPKAAAKLVSPRAVLVRRIRPGRGCRNMRRRCTPPRAFLWRAIYGVPFSESVRWDVVSSFKQLFEQLDLCLSLFNFIFEWDVDKPVDVRGVFHFA